MNKIYFFNRKTRIKFGRNIKLSRLKQKCFNDINYYAKIKNQKKRR